MEVRAIYLTEADWADYNRAQSKAYGCRLCAFLYGSHEIRAGEQVAESTQRMASA